ncbi:MAG TPA: TorF family putative porin, partial [Casimicrobiaceae bacterium]|nr:TorF family putative porin [Casimicrobiaceae bacterium]
MYARSRLILSLAVLTLAAGAGIAQAQTPPPPATPAAPAPEAKPDYTITGNFGIYSQYVFRGLTQTDQKPAFQGGFD